MKYDGLYNVNDTYEIKRDWDVMKKYIDEIEEDITVFLSAKKSKKRGSQARSKIARLKNEILSEISRKILKTNQDYKSDYS